MEKQEINEVQEYYNHHKKLPKILTKKQLEELMDIEYW